jgi:hypothetical protein
VKVGTKGFGLFEWGDGGWDGTDEWDRVGVDGEIVVQGIVEQGEEVRDLGVYLKQTPERKLGLSNNLDRSAMLRLEVNKLTRPVLTCVGLRPPLGPPLVLLAGRNSSSSSSSMSTSASEGYSSSSISLS